MTLRDKIESHAGVVFLGALVVGFLAGVSTYEGVLRMVRLELVPKDSYLLLKDVGREYIRLDEVERRYVRKEIVETDYVPKTSLTKPGDSRPTRNAVLPSAVAQQTLTAKATSDNPGENFKQAISSSQDSKPFTRMIFSVGIPGKKDLFDGDVVLDASPGSTAHRVEIVLHSLQFGELGAWTRARGQSDPSRKELGQGSRGEFRYKDATYVFLIRTLEIRPRRVEIMLDRKA